MTLTKIKRWVVLSAVAIGALSCTTPRHHGEISYGDIPTPEGTYDAAVEKWSNVEKAYQGLDESFQVAATLLAENIVAHQVFIDAEDLHWTPEQYREARDKALGEGQTSTKFFVSLYTNRDESNNLDKSNSIWNIFIDVNGHRYTPTTVKRIYENSISTKRKYPYVQVWSRYYYVTFPVSTAEVTSGKCVLTVAGPIGGTHLSFPKE